MTGSTIWLVEQFRYTIQERALELPQGGWEREIDNPEELARGELKEEARPRSRRDDAPGNSTGSPTASSPAAARVSRHRPQAATEKSPTPKSTISLSVPVPIAEFERMMLDGTIRDDCTLAAWGLYLLVEGARSPETPRFAAPLRRLPPRDSRHKPLAHNS